MEIFRSSFYAQPELAPVTLTIVDEIKLICTTSPAHGYRSFGAEPRHRGFVVNSKKVRRIMREQGLQPMRKRRFVATTDRNHDGPIFPNIAERFELHAPDHLWGCSSRRHRFEPDERRHRLCGAGLRLRLSGRDNGRLVAPDCGLCARPQD
ncbi:MAG: IS3 family transposase [Pseudomonadota bacterium]